MKLIKQSFEILEQKDFSLVGIKKFIERCGRVCYKSEDRITDDSYEKFVNMLEKRDHARPLEFGTVHLKIASGMLFEEFLQDLVDCELYNPTWIKYKKLPEYTYITTNYRHYLQIIKKCPYIAKYFTEHDNCYYPSRYTVHMILSRGIMDEFRTHVGLSHLAESTRYCNYSKDKFDNELTFIIPSWLDMHDTDEGREVTRNWNFDILDGCSIIAEEGKFDDARDTFLTSLNVAEHCYLELLQKGWTPQQAREVLPLSVKSELISCGFEDAWSNFFYRRCDNAAHPMARELACGLKEEFIKRNYIDCKKS
nr:MAG TPA: Thymidylate synthase complementing protein [Crassvirales sp.]